MSGPLRPRLFLLAFTSFFLVSPNPVDAHDIPNARVDRSIQVTLKPGRIEVAYEVSLSELTLTQELRGLIGTLPGADRQEWFATYGRQTGPLDAKGILVDVDRRPVVLAVDRFDLALEEHPRFTFRFSGLIPKSGTLSIQDTNYRSSEGTSRLAVRGAGINLLGDALPSEVAKITERPVWQLSDKEERRTHQVQLDYQPANATSNTSSIAPATVSPSNARPRGDSRLSRLFDRASTLPLAVLIVIAFGLGAAHAIQPGHGKTLVAATMLGEDSHWGRGAALAIVTTLTHLSSVLLVATTLWWTESSRFPEVHLTLTRGSGFVIASVGLWRLGRLMGGYSSQGIGHGEDVSRARGSLIGLGIAGGIVPCWDAVGLIVLSAALGNVGLGLALAGAFSLGMGSVMVAIGILASSLRSSWIVRLNGVRLERRLSLTSGLFLSAMGVYLLGV